MKLTKLTFVALLMVSILVTGIIYSCKKDLANSLTVDATIENHGDLAADGCGWLIKMDGADSTYFPTNLDKQYQVNNLKVHITYHPITTRYYCGMITIPENKGMPEINIDKIATK